MQLNLVISRLTGFITLLLGAVVLLGWYLHEPALIQVNPAFVPMQYNTALGFALAGLALLGLAWSKPKLAKVAGSITLVIGALTLVEYIFAVDLKIDQLFMEHYIDTKTSNPGRMAPNTALCFSLTGIAVLLTSLLHGHKTTTTWTATLGALIISLGITALAGYMIGVEGAYGWGHMTRMAIHTSAGFILLGTGLIAHAWVNYKSQHPHKKLPMWLPQVVGITVLTITLTLWQAVSAKEQSMIREMGEGVANLSDESLLLFGLLLTLALVFKTRSVVNADANRKKKEKFYAPWVVVLLGVLLATSLYNYLAATFTASVSQRFDSAVRNHAEAIAHGIETDLQTLYHIRSSFEASPFQGHQEFQRLVSHSLEDNPGIAILIWIPRVFAAERTAFETSVQQDLLSDFVILDSPARNGLVVAPQRSVHFPINYAEPQAEFGYTIGIDLAATPDRLDTLMRAANTGLPAVSSRIENFRQVTDNFAVFVALPVYQQGADLITAESRTAALIGFAVMVVQSGPMIEAILDKNTNPAGLSLEFSNTGSAGEPELIYRHLSRHTNALPGHDDAQHVDSNLVLTLPLKFADSDWQMTAYTANQKLYPAWDPHNLWLPFAILLFSFGLAYFLFKQKLAEAALQAEKIRADEANQAKSTFLANMSHELRTPMNAILGYSEMLIEDAEDLEQDDFAADLKKINQAGNHLLALINDVLDLSKVESGKMEAFPEYIDLCDMIDEVSATAHPLIEKNNNTLIIDRGDNLGIAYQDLTKLRQNLFNLLSNAAKFTHDGEITLHVSRAEYNGDDWLTISVSDTGIGIAEDRIDHVFEEFAQADSSTTRDYGGTGLGLAITRRFCKLLGGDLTARSEVGKGSTFTILIPANLPGSAEQQLADTPDEPTDSNTSKPMAPEQTDARILAIDDDPEALDIIKRFLVKDGFNVVTASSGEEGIRLAREIQPTAITLDVMMPGMNGWSVLRLLKADPELCNIPVIMLSMVDDRTRGCALGAVDYLTKPVDRDLLQKTLSRYHSPDDNCPVLVVEDDPATRELIVKTLTSAGWVVFEAVNGQEALDMMSTAKPGLILLDLMMPVMDGFSFIAALRLEPEWRHIPVIVNTAKDLSAADRKRLSGSVAEIMEKNAYTRDQLLEHVRDAVARINS